MNMPMKKGHRYLIIIPMSVKKMGKPCMGSSGEIIAVPFLRASTLLSISESLSVGGIRRKAEKVSRRVRSRVSVATEIAKIQDLTFFLIFVDKKRSSRGKLDLVSSIVRSGGEGLAASTENVHNHLRTWSYSDYVHNQSQLVESHSRANSISLSTKTAGILTATVGPFFHFAFLP